MSKTKIQMSHFYLVLFLSHNRSGPCFILKN
uniref:Uncharacterized protein n=1 Tax=Anguilla anguilla TaxID=7936 RepID=A0A0E9SHX1_ANGAN